MAYTKKTYTFRDCNDVEYSYAGNYGAKGEKRRPRTKPTPEQIEKQNQRNRAKQVCRLIRWNFMAYDLWCTLKYPRGTRKSIREVMKDIQKFNRKLRAAYKKQGVPYKWIRRVEIGERGGIHIHIIINRCGKDADKIVQECWEPGRVYYSSLYQEGGYTDLAEYITKKPNEQVEKQLSLFEEEERKQLISYSRSRNLVQFEPEVKKYTHWTMRRVLDGNGLPKPSEGYYIDKSSVHMGVNRYTGFAYLHYTEIKIGADRWGMPPDWEAERKDNGNI